MARRVPRLAGLVGEMLVGRYRPARGSDPQPQSSSLALPCQILVSVDGCQSLTAFGSCIHWMPAPSRRPKTPAGTAGKAQGGLPLGNPVCLWQTELFKLNLKSSPSSSGYNRRRRLATRSSGKQQAERTAVRTAPIVCPEESPLVRPQAHPPVTIQIKKHKSHKSEGSLRAIAMPLRTYRPDWFRSSPPANHASAAVQ